MECSVQVYWNVLSNIWIASKDLDTVCERIEQLIGLVLIDQQHSIPILNPKTNFHKNS